MRIGLIDSIFHLDQAIDFIQLLNTERKSTGVATALAGSDIENVSILQPLGCLVLKSRIKWDAWDDCGFKKF